MFFTAYPEASAAQVDGRTYDYIIVGGGTGGCVLANRLSEDPNVTVLLLEKGGVKDNMISRMPLVSQNTYDAWATEPLQVQHSRWSEPMSALNGRKNLLPGAEGIGGNSRINAMLWTRGPPSDYTGWADMGLADWDWEHVEPFFRKLENAVSHPGSQVRGHRGPVEMRQQPPPFEWGPFIQKAARNLGLPTMKDCNDHTEPPIGHFILDSAVDKYGQRVSAYKAFLNKKIALERRGRLTICTGVVASRLEVDAQKQLATGVYLQETKPQQPGSAKQFHVKARREIIICSGAIGTPQLLLMSGIGPKDSGKALDIPLIKELPAVGATLSDHYSFPMNLEVPPNESFFLLESIWGLWHMLLWLFFGTGLMSGSSVFSTIFLRSKDIDEDTMEVNEDGWDVYPSRKVPIPDIEIMLIPYPGLQKPVGGHSLFCLYPTLVQPCGTGRIELVDKNPLVHPRITHPMLNNDQDLKTARTAVRFTMRLAEEFEHSGYPYPAPLAFAPGNGIKFAEEWAKSEDRTKDYSKHVIQDPSYNKTWKTVTDDEIDDYMRLYGNTSLHYCSTCPMSNEASKGVVDQQLRIHGFKNLRIADASVFPRVTSGHTMAPTMMVAERCAVFVKNTWEGKL